jgi:hypothetical protein
MSQDDDPRPRITATLLRTIKGVPYLELRCVGERIYSYGEPVTQEDFIGSEVNFRGMVQHVQVRFENLAVSQFLSVALSQHDLMHDGQLPKAKPVKRAPPAAVPAIKPIAPIKPAEAGRRMFDFED